MRSLIRIALFAVLIHTVCLSGCGPSSSSQEATPPAAFAPTPNKDDVKSKSKSKSKSERLKSEAEMTKPNEE